jgi:hypothetical protein
LYLVESLGKGTFNYWLHGLIECVIEDGQSPKKQECFRIGNAIVSAAYNEYIEIRASKFIVTYQTTRVRKRAFIISEMFPVENSAPSTKEEYTRKRTAAETFN